MVTERIQYLYKKHERSLLEVYGNPVDGLIGLINNRILVVSHQITMIKEIMSPVPSDERPPVGEYIPEEYSPNYAPRYVEDLATNNPPPLDPEDVMSYEDLEVELDLLDLENCRLEITPNKSRHPNVMAIKATYLTVPDEENLAETGLLPMIYYLFEDANIGTTIFMDEGSNTSLITTKLAEALHLEGKVMLTMIFKAGEEIA